MVWNLVVHIMKDQMKILKKNLNILLGKLEKRVLTNILLIIFFFKKKLCSLTHLLTIPAENVVNTDTYLPGWEYPSDHFAIMAGFELNDKEKEK